MSSSTVPAPVVESALLTPPSARISPLAKAALEAGVSAGDVRAYLTSGRSEQLVIPADHPFAEATEASLALLLSKPVKRRTAGNRRDIRRVRDKSRALERAELAWGRRDLAG